MKLKELPPHTSLGGIKVKTPEGIVGYWAGQWEKGVWLSQTKAGGGQIFPIFVDKLPDAAEWEVVGDEIAVNVDSNSTLKTM